MEIGYLSIFQECRTLSTIAMDVLYVVRSQEVKLRHVLSTDE